MGDLWANLVSRAVLAAKIILSARSKNRTTKSIPNEFLQIYQPPFTPEIEVMDHPEKFNLQNLTMYDGNIEPRLHIKHFRQMITLWNHHDPLMCRVFPSSLGDLRLKCFNKLPATSIKSFLQIFELFMSRFVINTKASKGVSSLMALRKGKNETLHNYNKWYWEYYKKIEECSKELVMSSYNLRTDHD